MEKLSIIGAKILVEQIKETVETNVFAVPLQSDSVKMGKIIKMGDGVEKDKTLTIACKQGDVILFKKKGDIVRINNVNYMHINFDDVIGCLGDK